jgi:hypothetical protein
MQNNQNQTTGIIAFILIYAMIFAGVIAIMSWSTLLLFQ